MLKWLRQALKLAVAYNEAEKKYGKKWYKSKTLWVNLIALVALFLNDKLGFPLPQEEQMAILAVVNIILRFITKEPIRW